MADDESEAVITYADLCKILQQLGYEDPEGNVEDQLLQFRSKQKRDSYPEIVTLNFPTKARNGTVAWDRDVMIDMLVTTFGSNVDGGKRLRAILDSFFKN